MQHEINLANMRQHQVSISISFIGRLMKIGVQTSAKISSENEDIKTDNR